MTTVTLWLLVSIGGYGYREAFPSVTVAQFATVQECERVQRVIQSSNEFTRPMLRCIQAAVVKP